MAAQVREVELQSLREEAARAQRMLDWRQERRNQRDLAEAQVTFNVFIRACGLSCLSFKSIMFVKRVACGDSFTVWLVCFAAGLGCRRSGCSGRTGTAKSKREIVGQGRSTAEQE